MWFLGSLTTCIRLVIPAGVFKVCRVKTQNYFLAEQDQIGELLA